MLKVQPSAISCCTNPPAHSPPTLHHVCLRYHLSKPPYTRGAQSLGSTWGEKSWSLCGEKVRRLSATARYNTVLTCHSWTVPIAGRAYEDPSFPISVLCASKKQALTVVRLQEDIEDHEQGTIPEVIAAFKASKSIRDVLAEPDTVKKYAVVARGYSPACIFVTWYVPSLSVGIADRYPKTRVGRMHKR